MKILLSWLNDYADLGADVEALSASMTSLGLVVEDVEHVGATVEGVITARVVRTEAHPDAARVHRVYVDTGDGIARHVWCGAFNMQAGDVVPLAVAGTTMSDGRTIERRGILGIDSEGMLCSARELGLGDDHAGILILPSDSPLGVPYGDVVGVEPDVLFDLDISRNRPDCWGYIGVARDVAAHLGLELRVPAPTMTVAADELRADVEIVAGDRCGRFTSTVMSGVVVGPSAVWMQRRLAAAGMRPISNVVDVSNYVMLELNQPNHAYDLATLGSDPRRRGFRVRLATAGETMTTLDGGVQTFTADDLLICDADDLPIGVAGVMGGLDTEITGATSTVALEIAWFTPLGVMQTAARLGLRSEASARFERGVDPYGIDRAIARFVELLGETCPDLVVHTGAVDVRGEALPPAERSTDVRITQVNRILGTALRADELSDLLDPIGYSVSGDGDTRRVALPSWRPDSEVEIDVVEEVARHYGYERIGKTMPRSAVHGRLSPTQMRRRQLRAVLLGLGISEAMPNPFLAPDTLARAGLDSGALTITNPLVAEESVLRTSLRPGLLQAIAFNESHRRSGVALFEIGHVYPPGDGELPDEYEALGVVLAGRAAPDAMAVWREISSALGVGARVDQSRPPAGLHATRSATLSLGNDPIGAVGEIDPVVLEHFDVGERVAMLELDLDRVLVKPPKPALWKATSRMPSSDLDLAFALPEDVTAEKLERAIRQGAGALLVDLDLFDVYRADGVGGGRRSLAYRLRLQSTDRNLTDADIAAVRERCVAAASKLGAELRG